LVHKGRGDPDKYQASQNALFLSAASLLYILYLGLGPWPEFRYLIVLAPLAAILLAWIISRILAYRRWLGMLVLLLVIVTDELHQAPLGYFRLSGTVSVDPIHTVGGLGLRSPLAGYLYELTHHLEDPDYVIGRYLLSEARPGDVVLASYGDLTLQYYTGLRVVGGLQGQPLPPAPDWVILRYRNMNAGPTGDSHVKSFVSTNIDAKGYTLVDLPVKDFAVSNNPDPRFHRFRIPSDGLPVLMGKRRVEQVPGPPQSQLSASQP
jgi:hypothetical protein